MTATFQVREIRDGLEVTVTARRSRIAVTVIPPVTALFVAYFALPYAPWTVAVPIGLSVGVLAFLVSRRDKVATLRVNNLEFRTEGDLGEDAIGRRGVSRDVPRANVRWLEYQDERGGGDAPYYPSGLYAELNRGSVCVLPYLSPEQTAFVIEAIYKRFPDMPWDKKTAFDRHITVLNLDGSS